MTALSVNSEAQHLLICFRIASLPIMFKYVSCWHAKEAIGKSSAVALERTAYAPFSSIAERKRAISSLNIPGDGYPFDDPANLTAKRADSIPVFRL